jgi:hypothetical protein
MANRARLSPRHRGSLFQPAKGEEYSAGAYTATDAQTEGCLRAHVLRALTLRAARRALAKAHCRPGKVARPPHHSALVVVRQSPRCGRRLPTDTAVAVTLARPYVRSLS